MATTTMSVKYRPARIGFLVRDGNIDDLVEVAGINTLLWGGIYNPIIPVSPDTSFTVQLIKLFNVDVLYPINNSNETNNIFEKYKLLGRHTLFRHPLFKTDSSGKNELGFFDTLNIMENYWEKEFKHSNKEESSNCVLIKWSKKEKLKNLLSISFGYFPTTYNLKYDFEELFLKKLHAKSLTLLTTKSINRNLIKRIYPLAVTKLGLDIFGNWRGFNDGIYIGEVNDFWDLITFWNLRASGIYIYFLPLENIERCKGLITSHIKMISKIYENTSLRLDNVPVYYEDKKFQKIKNALCDLDINANYVYHKLDKISWNGLNIEPYIYYCNRKEVLSNIDYVNNRYNVAIPLPEKPFKEIERDIGYQSIITSVESIGEYEYPEHTLNPPYIQDFNEFYWRDIASSTRNICVSKEGIDIIIKYFTETIYLHPLSHQRLIEKLFNYVDINPSLSQAGIITKRIIEKLSNLEGCRIFKINGVRKLIDSLKSDESISVNKAKKCIWDNGNFKKHIRLFIEKRKERYLNTTQTFNFIIKNDIFRAGLELRCRYCNILNWLNLKEIDDIWTCKYCGFDNKTSLFLKDRGDWRFRKSGLFSKDNNQEGAIPVILTLMQLMRQLDNDNFIYSTSLNLASQIFNNVNCEIDFVALHYGRRENIEIGIGECKNKGGKIEKNDIENLKKIREKFLEKDIECYLIFSKTAEKFQPDEINLLKKLDSEFIPCIIFTNKELEPYEPYEEYTKTQLLHEYVHSLEGFAANSKHIYLT
ncbi:hypothetical protein ACFL4V_00430 [Candidatus Latescibacterota bacterium]